MNYNKITLEFQDRHLESEFKDHNDYSNRIFLRTGCIISIIKWIVVNIANYILFQEHFFYFFLITLTAILPLLISLFIIAWLEGPKRLYQWSAAFVNFTLACIALFFGFYYFKSLFYTTGSVIVMTLYFFFIFRLRFKIALALTSILVPTYQVLIFMDLARYTPDQLIINTGVLWYALVANIFGGYFLEKTSRTLFVNNRLLEKQKSEIEETNEKLITSSTELARAHEKLKELDRVKTNFFDNISHEIRTPLTLIITPIESAIRGDFKKPVDKTFLENLHRNSSRLLSLVNDLLDFSKIESGKMKINVREVDIVKFTKALVGTIQSAAESKGVALEFLPDTSKLNVFIDADKTEKIIINLLFNALKFTSRGGFIRVGIFEDKNNFSIEVQDSGQGIPGDKINYIFDRFSQIDTGSKWRFDGAGIGLSLAKELAEMQGGFITAESRFIEEYSDSHGTVFTMTLPKGREHFKEMNNVEYIDDNNSEYVRSVIRPELIEIKIKGDSRDLNKDEMEHTVLVVEDNPDMVNLLTDLLCGHYNILSVSNGKEALQFLQSGSHDVDLVIADIMMPVMDGRELTERIRREPSFEGLPIILLTAKADISTKIEGIERGATDYITKPFDARELVARIRAHIEMKVLRDRLKRSYEKLYNQLKKRKDTSDEVSDLSEEKVKIIIEFIYDNYDTEISRESLAAAVDMNPDHLSRVFNRYTGKKINEYINSIRIDEAKKKLENSDYKITEIAISVGFENLRTFNRYFLSATGISPTEYRNRKIRSV